MIDRDPWEEAKEAATEAEREWKKARRAWEDFNDMLWPFGSNQRKEDK